MIFKHMERLTGCPSHYFKVFLRNNWSDKKTITRFYKDVTVENVDQRKWKVLLDKFTLKTPLNNDLLLPNLVLACIIADEWSKQNKLLEFSTMNITRLTSECIDKPIKSYDSCATYMLDYLAGDTLIYQESLSNDLGQLQHKQWTPIVDWFNEKFHTNVNIKRGFIPTRSNQIDK